MKFRLLNIDFTVSYSLVCLGAICVILNIFLGFLCCVMAVIIHECGHLFAMLICKSPPDKIKISLFEIKITNSSRQLNTTRQNFFIIFFGPLVNFICFILFYCYTYVIVSFYCRLPWRTFARDFLICCRLCRLTADSLCMLFCAENSRKNQPKES